MIPSNEINYFEQFLSPRDRTFATNDLASKGKTAIPVLETLFNGSAKNQYGISYREIGALDCGYVTAKILGKLAKSLEKYIREGIDSDNAYAIEAAGFLADLEYATAVSLTKAVIRNPYGESPFAFVRCNLRNKSELLDLFRDDEKVVHSVKNAIEYLSKKT